MNYINKKIRNLLIEILILFLASIVTIPLWQSFNNSYDDNKNSSGLVIKNQ